jgi:hypothetical protein
MRISNNFNIRDSYRTLFLGHSLHLLLYDDCKSMQGLRNSTAYEMYVYLLEMPNFM